MRRRAIMIFESGIPVVLDGNCCTLFNLDAAIAAGGVITQSFAMSHAVIVIIDAASDVLPNDPVKRRREVDLNCEDCDNGNSLDGSV